MFDNIGSKIKKVAQVITWIGIVLSAIVGFLYMTKSQIVGIIVIGIGCLVSWLSSITLYGFGELIEKTQEIAENTKKN